VQNLNFWLSVVCKILLTESIGVTNHPFTKLSLFNHTLLIKFKNTVPIRKINYVSLGGLVDRMCFN